MHAQGAELAFTYQSERLKSNVEKIAAELGSDLLFECDVASDESIANMYQELSKKWTSFFYELSKTKNVNNILEIGTNLGVSGQYFLKGLDEKALDPKRLAHDADFLQ